MNIVEAWDGFTISEKQMFQNCCRKLIKRTFIVRDKQEDKRQYFFVSNKEEIFSDYFAFMGFEVKCDKSTGVVMLDSVGSSGDSDRLRSNRYRFSKDETIVLCCLWLIYISRLKEGTLSSVVVIGVSDLVYELEKYDARDMFNKTSLDNIFKVLKNFSLIDIDGSIGDMDCRLILYPSLQFALDIEEFERFVKEVVEVVLKDKDSIEEVSDDQIDDND